VGWAQVRVDQGRLDVGVAEQLLERLEAATSHHEPAREVMADGRRVGPTGYVLATDIAASMVGLTAAAARRAGLTNVGTRVMDAQSLDVDAESFDAVISRFGLMLIADPHKALTEIRRVLRGDGRVAAIVFSTPDQCPYLSIPHLIARRVGRLALPPEPFGEFRPVPGFWKTPTKRRIS